MKRDDGITLGITIRAYRQGFGQWRGFFVRLTGGHGEPFKAEVVPPDRITGRMGGAHFYAWWDSTEGKKAVDLDQITPIKHLVRVKLPFSFYFDDDGKVIGL